MLKHISLFFSSIFLTTIAFTQDFNPATAEQQRELILNITAASENMITLSSDFVQKKNISILADELISEGRLSFKKTDKLSWEYTSPHQYKFMMNGNNIMINSGTNQNIIDINSNRMFSEISRLIISGINAAGIFDSNRFTANFNVGTNDYQVVLTPRQRTLRQLFSNITITFDKNDYSVNTIKIIEAGGDTTFITLINKQINIDIDDAIFAIR